MMRRIVAARWLIFCGCAPAALMAGCASRSFDSASRLAAPAAKAMNVEAPARVSSPGGGEASEARRGLAADMEPAGRIQPIADIQPDRYLIRNASLTLEVKDASESLNMVTAAVRTGKGYVSEMTETADALGARSIAVTVRIPAAGFDASMHELEKLGKVLDRQVTAEDVTEEYVDSGARVRNLKRSEERLLTHLSRTGKLSDTLLVEKELSRVREEIERLEGRLRFLSHRISFSTVIVNLREAPRKMALVPPETFSSGQVASDATRSLVGFGQSVWSGAIWLGIWAVVWLPALLLTSLVVRRAHSGRQERREPTPG